MKIQRLEINDVENHHYNMRKLLKEVYQVNFEVTNNLAEELCIEKISSLKEYIENKSAIVFGVIDDDELIAFIWLYKHEFFGEERLHINQVVVNNTYRGKGIGKMLVQEAENHALKENIKKIDLFVSEKNIGALNLYNKLEFETERRYLKKEL